jgi:MSP (Major sperm protein) domain
VHGQDSHKATPLSEPILVLKVKASNPGRYRIQPLRGMISPNCSETIQILIVESESDFLLQAFESLGQDALGRSNDLFLIQSCSVNDSFRKQHEFPTGPFKKVGTKQSRFCSKREQGSPRSIPTLNCVPVIQSTQRAMSTLKYSHYPQARGLPMPAYRQCPKINSCRKCCNYVKKCPVLHRP